MALLKVSRISKQLGTNIVLQEITFNQKKFQKLAIVGESGSGKSTLLKIIGGLIQPDAGDVLFENKHVEGPNEKLIPGHPKMAYLSQHFELRNNYRVEEILEYANTLPEQEAETLFEVCHIRHLLKRKTDQVSGGEKQRIAMARLLIGAPKLFLLDEPFSNLDNLHRNTLRAVIRAMGEKLGITSLMVSHDPVDALSWADEIIVMKSGQIIQQDTPEKVYRQPVNEYAAGLFGKFNAFTKTEAAAFGEIPKAYGNGKRLYIRPEAFTLVAKKSKTAVAGKVTEVSFLGSGYEIEIALANSMITVRTENNSVEKGDAVFVTFKK
ncbi:ABC transporter [Niastella yeongjuensis]|uniref:ABC transporter n=1 Tax=Niastella yeongjuensis TaxID=354355 RepID=A0A1V9ENZ0_9BACT|nr:ABC transporter ATP-binding protein [Niastella yeongjuensis]OQP47869.1 ABC transporter [Niastella yeongjuensis]SEP48242.1 iron(III) transport system ATP-binding protein [Niastella yeongjuensis]